MSAVPTPRRADSPVAPRRPRRIDAVALAKPALFCLALVPALALAWQLWHAWNGEPNRLGANPVKSLEHATGDWTLRFLALTLAVTPVRRLTGWNAIVRLRRMLGLFAFFYATTHLVVYAGLDLELNFGDLAREIAKRPYITLGFACWLLLLPLAVTSTQGWIRRLGGRRWNRLHRLTYVVAVGGTIHYYWSVKRDVTEPLLWAALFLVLLGWRAVGLRRTSRPA